MGPEEARCSTPLWEVQTIQVAKEMKIVLKLCMLMYGMLAAYCLPWVILPWGSEYMVRSMAALNIFESLTIIGLLFFLCVLAEAEVPQVDVDLDEPTNVKEFKRNV